MKALLLRVVPSLLHLLLTILYFNFIFGSNGDYLETRLLIGFYILLLSNAVSSTLVSKGQWRQFLISLVSFGILFILYNFYLLVTGDPTREIDDNPAEGLVLLVMAIPLSIISLLLGTTIGITITNLIKQIKKFHNDDYEG